MPQIHKLMVHERPELDEAVALYILRRYGRTKFPGVTTAEIGFCPAGSQPPEYTADEWEDHGVLYIGVGGGRFDHHCQVDRDRQANHSATSLVAKALEIQRKLELKMLLTYVTDQELKGDPSPFGLSRMAHYIGEVDSTDPLLMFKWVWKAISAYIGQGVKFHGSAKQAFEAGKRYEIGFDPAAQKPVVMFVATDDEPQLKSYAFYRRARIAVLRQTSGHTSVFVNNPKEGAVGSVLDLTPIVIAIRRAELREKGKSLWPDEVLVREVGPPELPEWYYQPVAGWLLNGSRTQPGMPATQLPLDKIVEIVRTELSKQLEPIPAP